VSTVFVLALASSCKKPGSSVVSGVSTRVVAEPELSMLAISAAGSNLDGWRDFAHVGGLVSGRSVEVLALIEINQNIINLG
jgi:hypothetical protein